jgi:tetratricopeptide (TPR) repeat protein
MARMKVFISHSHRDATLAKRFEDFLTTITSNQVEVKRSSKDGSIEYGNSWIDWIHDQVAQAQASFILLTPSSFAGKWVLWEAGAVEGVRRMTAANGTDANAQDRQVIPIKFLLAGNEEMGPFQSVQVADGLNPENLYELSLAFQSSLRQRLDREGSRDIDRAMSKLEQSCAGFVEDAETIFRDLPISQRQDLVLEWTARLDTNLAKGNAAFVRSARRWINIAFLGAAKEKADDKQTPIDFRLHVRLAEGFRQLKEWGRAKEQLLLAQQLSPRDMLVLRELGRAELETNKKDTKAARELLSRMKNLDPDVLAADEEALMLQVRIFVEDNDWAAAAEVLDKAPDLARESTYVANMRAVAALHVDSPNTKRYFQDLLDRERKGGRRDMWTLGNLVNAALALGDTEAADKYLGELGRNPEAALQKDSIGRYFDDIVRLTRSDYDWRSKWT